MDIVCVSHNAPPLNDAEALCTARLLSALVDCGANAHLVAAGLPPSLEPSICAELMDKRIKTTYGRARTNRFARLAAGLNLDFTVSGWNGWARHKGDGAVLQEYENPILLTREFPLAPNMVAYYCRKDARAWVRVSAIRYPPFEWQNHWYSRLVRPVNGGWARQSWITDLATVTCPNTVRYIEEKSGFLFVTRRKLLPTLPCPSSNLEALNWITNRMNS